MSPRDFAALLACALAPALGCAPITPAAPVARTAQLEPAAPPAEATPRVSVHYAAGGCVGGRLEIEVFERETSSWRPHPEHPHLEPGACALEAPGRLFNELRVRCVDPAGRRPASDWVVGAELASAPGGCPPND